jgi:DNA-binding beta-propeller fold protein YncE
MHSEGKLLAVADSNGRSVHVLNLEENAAWTVAVGREVPFSLEVPTGVAWAGDRLCIADGESHQIVIVEPSRETRVIGRDLLERPAGVAFNRVNDLLYVSDAKAHCIVAMDLQGHVVHRFGSRGAGTGELNAPAQLDCAEDGDVWVADALNFRVQRFSSAGEPLGGFGAKGDAGGDFALPKGVAVDAVGNIWVVDAQFENVQVFDRSGRLLLAFGEEGRNPGEFWLPAGADVDRRNRLWIADSYNRRVQLFEILP